MDISNASFAFAALSQPMRLEVVRLLVAAGPSGLAAGSIADALAAKQNTMSANLAILQRSGLITKQRSGRNILYCADITAIANLIGFMLQDCCGGKPELCSAAMNSVFSQSPDDQSDCHHIFCEG